MNEKRYFRFATAERLEHWLLFLSFTLLALTGLPQKYAAAGVSQALISLLGGIETIRIIHRIAATVFLLEAVYHLVVVGYKLYVRRLEASMLPGIKDGRDALQSFAYNLGFTKNPPKMPRYNFAEKAEYWAMIWGLIMMGLTGFMLWNPILTARALPGQFIPAAKAAHGAEAVLAVLAIIVWHFYNVHLKSWNAAMFKGTLTEEQMEEDHAEELDQLEAGKVRPAVIDPATASRRKMVYFPIAAVVSLVLLFGIYWVVTAEKTAIDTVIPPEQNIVVYSPVTPSPAPTLAAEATTVPAESGPTQPVEATTVPSSEGSETAQPAEATPAEAPGGTTTITWDDSIGALFASKCAMCHGTSGGLALDTYANAMKGGATGPVIIAGNPDTSPLVVLQQKGGHPGQFTTEELQQVMDWIKAGALEK